LKSSLETNILLNVKCIGWCLSFSELKKIHYEKLKFKKKTYRVFILSLVIKRQSQFHIQQYISLECRLQC